MKFKKTTLGLVLGASLLVVPNDNTLQIQGEFSPEMVRSATDQLNDALDESRQLLLVNSPGGQVPSRDLIKDMLEGRTVDSYVKSFAASAAADTAFEVNGTIYVEKDAQILFHGAHVVGQDGQTYGQRDFELVLAQGAGLSKEQLLRVQFMVDMLKQINERSLESVLLRHPNVNKKVLLEDVYGNFERDGFVTGQKLKDLGFDVVLGAPDVSDYKTKSLLLILLNKLMDNTVISRLFK